MSLSTWRAHILAIACSMVDIRSSSMADRYKADECRVSGGEEGVLDQEHVDLSEPGVGAENRTMMRVLGWTWSFWAILSYCKGNCAGASRGSEEERM